MALDLITSELLTKIHICGTEKNIKKKHVNINFTGLSWDFGGDFVLAPTQSRDNPANLFMFISFFFPWNFLRSFPLFGAPVVQSYWAWNFRTLNAHLLVLHFSACYFWTRHGKLWGMSSLKIPPTLQKLQESKQSQCDTTWWLPFLPNSFFIIWKPFNHVTVIAKNSWEQGTQTANMWYANPRFYAIWASLPFFFQNDYI